MCSKAQNNCPLILLLHCKKPEHLATLQNCLREQDLYAESIRAGQFQDSPLTHIKTTQASIYFINTPTDG